MTEPTLSEVRDAIWRALADAPHERSIDELEHDVTAVLRALAELAPRDDA